MSREKAAARAERRRAASSKAVDPADAHNKLGPWLGTDGPRWRWHNVDDAGKNFVVVTVDPPRWGDRPHALRKEWRRDPNKERYRDGAVFVRRPGKTEEANHADIALLGERASRAQVRLELRLAWEQPAAALVATVRDDTASVTAWITDERKRMEADARRASTAPPSPDVLAGLATVIQALEWSQEPETRTIDAYLAELEDWAAATEAVAAAYLRARGATAGSRPGLTTVLLNETDRNFENARIDMYVPGPVTGHLAQDKDRVLPARPRAFGPRPRTFPSYNFAGLAPSLIPRAAPKIWVDNGGSATITFAPVHMRPKSPIPLTDFWLVGSAASAGSSVAVAWSATATNGDGRVTGNLDVRFATDPLTLADVVARARQASS